MENFNPEPGIPPSHLATDLDGTLIPLPDHPENLEALDALRHARSRGEFGLIFCTGRHFESVRDAMASEALPEPDWIICDVGTSIYHQQHGDFHPHPPYQDHLADTVAGHARDQVQAALAPVDRLSLQCDRHQQKFKISFECATGDTENLLRQVTGILVQREFPYQAHASIDPFLDCGLIDVLPRGVSKAYALRWLSTHAGFHPGELVYAGDSGNDAPALTGGFRAILVANAGENLETSIRGTLEQRGLAHLLYSAHGAATSGVLEGCRHFGLL